jgi:hypothetical protein
MFSFGKHVNEKYEDVASSDPEYCRWFINTLATDYPIVADKLCKLVNNDSIYLTFGKYVNNKMSEIAEKDIGYIKWLASSDYINSKRKDILKEAHELLAKHSS